MAGFCGAAGGGDVSTDSLWAATGDIVVATGDDAATVLAVGSCSAILQIDCGTPAWTTTPSLAGLTATGDFTTTGAAIDWDLKDDCSSALSFDATCQAGILTLVTTNCSEGVTMSGTLGVTGALTATAGITVGSDGSGADVTFHSETGSDNLLWDASCEKLVITGTNGQVALSVADGDVYIADNIELGHACDTTLARASAGEVNIQGNRIYRAGGTDVAVADGGTNLSCYAVGDIVYASGTTTLAKLTKGDENQVLTMGGSNAPTWADAGGGGVVSGGTDNAILRADGTGGSTSQGSVVTINDTGYIYGPNGCACTPTYSFTCDTNSGLTLAADGCVALVSAGVFGLRVGGAKVFIGNETLDSNITRGLSMTQAEHDNTIFALKSSDVEHNTTDLAETDTFAFMKKAYNTGGGLNLYGMTDGNAVQAAGIILSPVLGIVAQATKTASGVGILTVNTGVKAASGGGVADAASNGNLFAIRGILTGNAKFLVDQEGDIFYDGSAAAYDSYCDAELTRTLAHTMQAASCEPSTIIRNKWDDFTAYNEQSLIDAGILGGPVIGVDAHDRGLVSLTQLQRLHNGAIWQLHSKLNDQAEELTALKRQLTALTEGK